MGAYLHGNDAAVLIAHLSKQLLQVGRFGGGMARRAMLTADFDAHRANKAGAVAQMLGNVVNQVRGCGFTVGTRNAYQGKFLGGFAVESGCHARHGLAGILYHNFRDIGGIRQIDLALNNQNARATIDGVLSIGMTIALQAYDAAECITWLYAIASVRNAGNQFVCIADDGAINTFEQLSACLLSHENLNSE